MEAAYTPVTKATARVTILVSDRQSWFASMSNESMNHDLEFRGRVIAADGQVIVTFRDMWTPDSPPDMTWPSNRCEQIFLSPGTYRLELLTVDWSKGLELAHCSDSFAVPDSTSQSLDQPVPVKSFCQYDKRLTDLPPFLPAAG